QNIHHLGRLVEAAPADAMAEKDLLAEVVPARIERKHPLTNVVAGIARAEPRWLALEVHADARADARKLLYVLLRVACVDTQRVQLEQLAGVVLVDLALRVLRIVEVDQHRGVHERGEQEVAETPEHVRADRALLVVRYQHFDLALTLED